MQLYLAISATAFIVSTSVTNTAFNSTDLLSFFKKDLHRSILQEFDPRQNSTITGKGIWVERDMQLVIGDQHGPSTTIAPITIRRVKEFCEKHAGSFTHTISRGEPTNARVAAFNPVDGIHECSTSNATVLFDLEVETIETQVNGTFVIITPHIGKGVQSRDKWQSAFAEAHAYIPPAPVPVMQIGARGKVGEQDVLIVEMRLPIVQVQFEDGTVRWLRSEEITLLP